MGKDGVAATEPVKSAPAPKAKGKAKAKSAPASAASVSSASVARKIQAGGFAAKAKAKGKAKAKAKGKAKAKAKGKASPSPAASPAAEGDDDADVTQPQKVQKTVNVREKMLEVLKDRDSKEVIEEYSKLVSEAEEKNAAYDKQDAEIVAEQDNMDVEYKSLMMKTQSLLAKQKTVMDQIKQHKMATSGHTPIARLMVERDSATELLAAREHLAKVLEAQRLAKEAAEEAKRLEAEAAEVEKGMKNFVSDSSKTKKDGKAAPGSAKEAEQWEKTAYKELTDLTKDHRSRAHKLGIDVSSDWLTTKGAGAGASAQVQPSETQGAVAEEEKDSSDGVDVN